MKTNVSRDASAELAGSGAAIAVVSTSRSAPTAARATTISTCSARCAPPRCSPKPSRTTPSAFDAANALRAATLDGAKALGWNERIGSIEAGKQADLVAVRLDEIETQPMYNVISQLVYAAGRHQVSDVWIAGARKLRDAR